MSSALELKERGNAFFKSGELQKALDAYTEALAAPDLDTSLRVTLLSNRAITYIKLGNWRGALGDCNEGLKLDPQHAKLLERRGIARKEIEKEFIANFMAQQQAQQQSQMSPGSGDSASIPVGPTPMPMPTQPAANAAGSAGAGATAAPGGSRFVKQGAVRLEGDAHTNVMNLMQTVMKQGGRMTKEQEAELQRSLARGQAVSPDEESEDAEPATIPAESQMPSQLRDAIAAAAAQNEGQPKQGLSGVWATEGGASLAERLRAQRASEPPKEPKPAKIRDRTARSSITELTSTQFEHQYHALEEDGSTESVSEGPSSVSVLAYALVVRNGCLLMVNEAVPEPMSPCSPIASTTGGANITGQPMEITEFKGDTEDREIIQIKRRMLSPIYGPEEDEEEEKVAAMAPTLLPAPTADLSLFADGVWTAPLIPVPQPEALDEVVRRRLAKACRAKVHESDDKMTPIFTKVTPLRVLAIEDFPSRAAQLTLRYTILADVDVDDGVVAKNNDWLEQAFVNRPRNANFAWVPLRFLTATSGLNMSERGAYLNVLDQIGNLDRKVRKLQKARCHHTRRLMLQPHAPLPWSGAGAAGFGMFQSKLGIDLAALSQSLRFAHHLVQLAVVARPCTRDFEHPPAVLLVRPKPAPEHISAMRVLAERQGVPFDIPSELPWMLPTTHLERGESIHFASRRLARGAFGLTFDSGFGLVHIDGGLDPTSSGNIPITHDVDEDELSQYEGTRGYRFTVATSFRAHGKLSPDDPEIPEFLAQPHALWRGVVDRNFITQPRSVVESAVPEHRWFTLHELEEIVRAGNRDPNLRIREDVLEHAYPLLHHAENVAKVEKDLFEQLEGVNGEDDESTLSVEQRGAAASLDQIESDFAWAPLGTAGIFSVDAVIASASQRT